MEIPRIKRLQQRLAALSQSDKEDMSDITLTELNNSDYLNAKPSKPVDVFSEFMDLIFKNESDCLIKIPKIWRIKLCNVKIYLPNLMFLDIDLIDYWKFQDYSKKIDISRFGEAKQFDALSIELLYNSNIAPIEFMSKDIEYNINRGMTFLPLKICTHSQILQSLSKKQLLLYNDVSAPINEEKDQEKLLKSLFDLHGFEIFINIFKLQDKILQLLTDKVINITNFNNNHLISNIIKEDVSNYCNWILQITNIYYDSQFENFINDIFYKKYFLLKKIQLKRNMNNFKYFFQKLEKSLVNEGKKRNVNNLFCITIFNTIITLMIVKKEELKIIHSFNLLVVKNKSAKNENSQNMLKLLMFIEIARKNMMIDLNSDSFIQLQ